MPVPLANIQIGPKKAGGYNFILCWCFFNIYCKWYRKLLTTSSQQVMRLQLSWPQHMLHFEELAQWPSIPWHPSSCDWWSRQYSIYLLNYFKWRLLWITTLKTHVGNFLKNYFKDICLDVIVYLNKNCIIL